MFLGICLITLLILVFWGLGYYYKHIRVDFERLETETYDTLFLSMYSTDNYSEEDYMHFRGMQTVKCDYEIPNGSIMKWYMKKAMSTGNDISTVYMGIDPQRVDYAHVQELTQSYPNVSFEIVYCYPQISYWQDMKEKVFENAMEKYKVFAENMLGVSNVRLYFFSGEEWLICNKGNYDSLFSTNAAVSQFIMCNSDYKHAYMLKPENLGLEMEKMQMLIESYRSNPIEYPNAESYDIVFIGDSIFGNYTDSLSIPEVVRSLTDARVYNCGYGGKSAAQGEKDDCPVSMIAEALVQENVSKLPKDTLLYTGIENFLKREIKNTPVMFVINYGLNDYFNGYPVELEDEYDNESYSGALRSAISTLQKGYPDAHILINTPTFTMYYECGEEVHGEKGGKLTDYVEAVIQIGQEMGVEVLDNYHDLPITEENWPIYQTDGCHLNERGRFMLGSRIASIIP